MLLHNLKPAKGSVRKRKRVGRGQGSTRGGTSTRGHNGAQSRSGYSRKFGFEGGQQPLQRRVPKIGKVHVVNKLHYKILNLDRLQSILDAESVTKLTVTDLHRLNLLRKCDKVKILGRGRLTSTAFIEAHAFSSSAKQALEEKGGSAILTS